jgi:hypothetical protein
MVSGSTELGTFLRDPLKSIDNVNYTSDRFYILEKLLLFSLPLIISFFSLSPSLCDYFIILFLLFSLFLLFLISSFLALSIWNRIN